MARYLVQFGSSEQTFLSDTAPHALACATAIAQALQLTCVLQQCGDATTRQAIAAPAPGNPTGVGTGISNG
jgi:hypothetical protein